MKTHRGFSLIEVLVAMFVLVVAVTAAVCVVVVGTRICGQTKDMLIASELTQIADADLRYTCDEIRRVSGNDGRLLFSECPAVTTLSEGDFLGTAGYQRRAFRVLDGRNDQHYGWVWRAHDFDGATGCWRVDIWAIREPAEIDWGGALSNPKAVKSHVVSYTRSLVETRR